MLNAFLDISRFVPWV